MNEAISRIVAEMRARAVFLERFGGGDDYLGVEAEKMIAWADRLEAIAQMLRNAELEMLTEQVLAQRPSNAVLPGIQIVENASLPPGTAFFTDANGKVLGAITGIEALSAKTEAQVD